MKVAVIGAGVAGLIAIKRGKEAGLEVSAFEQTAEFGGQWIYSDRTGLDKHGQPVVSCFYRDLRTNSPKDIMGFPDFQWERRPEEESYVRGEDFLQFIRSFVEDFGLREHIRFEHLVVEVDIAAGEREETKWRVVVKDLNSGRLTEEIYDAVFVCNGHHNVANVPDDLPGLKEFPGKVTHSRDFRVNGPFEDSRTLIIGCGPSGMDLTFEVAKNSREIFFSHHSKHNFDNQFPPNVIQKPDVRAIRGHQVEFTDSSTTEIDQILLCTGYRYAFPFLTPRCSIEVRNHCHVWPLWKHCVNIRRPNMFFIGLMHTIVTTYSFDLQVRFCIRFLTGGQPLPGLETMLADLEADMADRRAKGCAEKDMHLMGPFGDEYCADLAATAGVEPIKPVYLKIYARGRETICSELRTYRDYRFRILNDENFVQFK